MHLITMCHSPELYLSWTSFTRVTLADRLKIPSISKPDTQTHTNTEKGRSEWENDLFRELKSKLISALCLCFHQHKITVPCSARKVMVSLITTGTQSPSGLLCLSLTHNTAIIVRSWLGFYHLAFTLDLVTYNASGTPNIWLGRGGLRGGDMGGWAVGFRDALNLLSYLTRKQCEIRAAVNVTGPNAWPNAHKVNKREPNENVYCV